MGSMLYNKWHVSATEADKIVQRLRKQGYSQVRKVDRVVENGRVFNRIRVWGSPKRKTYKSKSALVKAPNRVQAIASSSVKPMSLTQLKNAIKRNRNHAIRTQRVGLHSQSRSYSQKKTMYYKEYRRRGGKLALVDIIGGK